MTDRGKFAYGWFGIGYKIGERIAGSRHIARFRWLSMSGDLLPPNLNRFRFLSIDSK